MRADVNAAAVGWDAGRSGHRPPVLADPLARGRPLRSGRAVEIASDASLLTPLTQAH